MRDREKKILPRVFTIVSGSAFAIVAGLGCLLFSFGAPFAHLSYDLPFLWRTTLDTHEIALVYLDDDSAKQLKQPLDEGQLQDFCGDEGNGTCEEMTGAYQIPRERLGRLQENDRDGEKG